MVRGGLVLALWLGMLAPPAAVADIAPSRQTELIHMLKQDCGSCHGMRLTGGLGPALTPQTLAGKSPAMLRAVILDGRPGTPMPPWRPFLNPQEAEWLVQILKDGRQ